MICCIIQKVNSLQHRTQILRYKFNNSENFVNYQFSSVFNSKTKHWSEPCHGMAWGIVPIYNMDHIRKRGNLYKVHFVASVHHLRKCCVNVLQRSQYDADGCITMVLWVYVLCTFSWFDGTCRRRREDAAICIHSQQPLHNTAASFYLLLKEWHQHLVLTLTYTPQPGLCLNMCFFVGFLLQLQNYNKINICGCN